MSNEDFKVEVVEVKDILPHPNADRLEIAVVKGWNCVVKKGQFTKSQLAVYFPIDSILPNKIEAAIFGEESKVKLTKGRVKTIKLRGAISQGLLVPQKALQISTTKIGQDLTSHFKVTKYEPPPPSFQGQSSQAAPASKLEENSHFHKYHKWCNAKNYPDLFQPEDMVFATEKIHGTNFRAGWVPFEATTLLKKIKKFFRLAPEYVFVYGSHNVQLSEKILYNGYYDKNIYAKTVKQYKLEEKIPKGLVIYGEIYGDGIQKNYSYGLTQGETKLVLFDAMKTGKYLDSADFILATNRLGIDRVPSLFYGKYKDFNFDDCMKSPSKLDGKTTKEGAVLKSPVDENSIVGRKGLKMINPEYLLKDQTDYH